jgi:hypothetical protein
LFTRPSGLLSLLLISALLSTSLLGAPLTGCSTGPTPESLQVEADAAINAKDWTGAVLKADTALALPAVSGDAAKAWRFELIRLNALAAAGKGKEVSDNLNRLSATYAKQLTASLYHSLAVKVKAGGDNTGSIDLLDAGYKKFPDDTTFQTAIDEMKNSDDPEEIARLKALGYL